jgi:AraC-like DNA-binding protein
MRTLVRSATLNGYLDVARSLHLDPALLMRQVGLEPADLSVPDAWVSAPAVARLLAASAAASNRPDFALLLAERRRLSTLGPLSVVLREEPDLGSVVHLLMRHERSYNEALRIRLTEEGELVTVQLWFEFGERAPVEQALALGVGALFGILRECGGSGWRPLSVCFSYPAPGDLEGYRRLFGPALRFGHEFTGLVLYASDLAAGNALADPLMRPYATRILDSVVSARATTWAGRVKELVELLLPLGKCSIGQVAKALGVDRRTLQRRLTAEGTSFAAILHSTRAGLAERYLSSDRYSVTEVSDLLGFAAPSGFSRWFAQQFGVSPREWRAASTARAARAPAAPA